ncbi:hypothetical protein MMC19_000888 [Ptychographa xylographoides]|nr:hypothetical protein [Ptychographa xylographoides]
MGGGDTHPGFPHADPTASYWQLPPHRLANHRATSSLPTSTTFDHVIIGSGISGAAIAYKLLSRNASLSILMLEARTAASGASGRNGGHCRAGFWLNFKRYYEALGEDEALKFERLEEENVRNITDFVVEHDIDNDFRDVETADMYLTQEAWDGVLEVVKLREEVRKRRPDAGPLTKRKVMHGQEARDTMGMPSIVGAVTYPAHTQNPYLLVCRMLELSLDKGLNLQTNTCAMKLVKSADLEVGEEGAGWSVQTDRGTVKAKNVVLATNAYTNSLYPGLKETGFLTPGRSQVTAIRPGSNISGNPALRRSAGLNDFNGSGDYFMSRAPGLKGEGDILYGGGRSISKTKELGITDDSKINPEIAAYLQHAAPKFFGHERWGEEEKEVMDWTGITCYTPDTFPLVGEAPGEKGLWCSVGMNGHGMAMAFRSAEALVEMMVEGREPEWFPKSLRLGRAWRKPVLDLPIEG